MLDFSKPMEGCRRLQGVPRSSTNDPPGHDAKAYNEQLQRKLQSEAIGKPSHGNSFLRLMDLKLQEEAIGKPSHGGSFLQLRDVEPQASEEGLNPAQPSKDVPCARTKDFNLVENTAAARSQLKQAHKEPEKKHNVEQEKEFEVIELHEGEEDDLVIVDKIDGIEDDYVEV